MSQTLVPPSAPPNPSPPPAASTPPGPPPGGVVRERGRIEYKWLAAGVVIFGTVMAILDQTVVNVALPKLESDFNTSLTNIQWVITGYSLALASVIPLSGWLVQRLGTKWVLIVSELLFIGGSALCGLAWSENALIAFRILQGLGGGFLMPVGMTILMQVTPPDERGRMMAVLGVPMMLGPILGPLLGGWLVQDYTWRLIFYINVPIGIVAVILQTIVLRSGRDKSAAHYPLDVFGLVLVIPGVVGIVYGLSQPDTYGWGSYQTLVPLIGGALLLVGFVLFELRQRFPLLDIKVFKDWAYAAAVTLVLLVAVSLFGAVFLLPLFLQQIQGYGTLESGFLLAFTGIAAAITMPLSGRLVDKVGAAKIVPFGVIVLTAASIWTATISHDTSRGVIILMMLTRGVGMGFTMMPAMSSAYVTLAPRLIPGATAITNVVQRVGSALGVAIFATILTDRISAHLPAIPGHASLGGNTSTIASLKLPEELKTIILQQATKGFDDTFWVAAGIGMLCFPAAFLLQRARSAREVHAYAKKQMEVGILLGAAAQRVRDGVDGRIQEADAQVLYSSLAGSAKARLRQGAMMMRMGSNAGGMVPRQPMSNHLKVMVAAATVVGVGGAIFGIAKGYQPPSVPDIAPLLAQLQQHAPPGH